MTSPAFGIVRLSTDNLPERDRVEVAREVYGRTILKHDIEPTPGVPFRFDAVLYALPGLALGRVTISACRAPRRPEHITGDDLVFNLTLDGHRFLAQRGREAMIASGDGVLTSSDPGLAVIEGTSRALSFRLARKKLAPLIGDLDASLLRPVKSNNGALRLLPGYVAAIEEAAESSTPELRALMVDHVYDLIALSLGATRDAAATAMGRGVRAARLHALKEDVIAHLGENGLSIAAVAARHGITPRYVGMLFNDAGESFSSFVLDQRLARARRMLSEARYSGSTISAIAFACGFGDLSYFNRAFRRAYGATPSDIRATHGA